MGKIFGITNKYFFQLLAGKLLNNKTDDDPLLWISRLETVYGPNNPHLLPAPKSAFYWLLHKNTRKCLEFQFFEY